MNLSSIIMGLISVIFGISMLIFIKPLNFIYLAIGISLVSLGLYMILNSNEEDKIEQIKK